MIKPGSVFGVSPRSISRYDSKYCYCIVRTMQEVFTPSKNVYLVENIKDSSQYRLILPDPYIKYIGPHSKLLLRLNGEI